MRRNEAISRARAALENSVADEIEKAYEEGFLKGVERGKFDAQMQMGSEDDPLKARLRQVVNDLPKDIGRVFPDLVSVLQWMADPDRRYQQGGTGSVLKPGGDSLPSDAHVIGVAPGVAAPNHHYFLVFSPKPYRSVGPVVYTESGDEKQDV